MPSIRKLASGRWQARVVYRYKEHSATFRTRALAEAWARRTVDELETGQVIRQPSEMTVAMAARRYRKEYTPNKKSASKEISRITRIIDDLGEVLLEKLTHQDVVAWIEGRRKSVSSDAARKELGTLSVIVQTAIDLWDIQAVNPCIRARSILTKHKTLTAGNKRERRPTKKELEVLAKDSHADLWTFLIETAMRRGEVAAMKKEHRDGDKLHIPTTKTGKPRTIPLSDLAQEILDRHPNGFNMTPDAITRAMSRLELCDGGSRLRVHDLRHEATSRLFESGKSIPEVAAITGHETWSQLKRYTHL